MKRFSLLRVATVVALVFSLTASSLTVYADETVISETEETVVAEEPVETENTEESDEVVETEVTETVETTDATEVTTESTETQSETKVGEVEVEVDLSDYVLQDGGLFKKDAAKEIANEIPEYVSGSKKAYEEIYDNEIEVYSEQSFDAANSIPDAEIEGFKNELAATCAAWDGKSDAAVISILNKYPTLVCSEDDVKNEYFKFINDNAQFFYVNSKCRYTRAIYRTTYSDGTVVEDIKISKFTIEFDQRYTLSDIDVFNNKVDSILGQFQSGWTDYDKVVFLHEYIVNNCHYDTEREIARRSAYDCLVEGNCVCQGYALAFDYLCKRANVSCFVVTSDKINHAWNLVSIGSNKYFVDCTWDDPLFSGQTGASQIPFRSYAQHTELLTSKYACMQSHESTDWLIDNGSQSAMNYGTDRKFDNADFKLADTIMSYNKDYGWGFIVSAGYPVQAYNFRTLTCSNVGNYTSVSATYPIIRSCELGFLVADNTHVYLITKDETKTIFTSATADRGYRILDLDVDINNKISIGYYSGYKEIDRVKTGSISLPSFVKSVTLSGITGERGIALGETLTLKATIVPSTANDKSLSWTSSNPTVVSVDQTGKIKALKVGTATITAVANDRNAVSGYIEVNVYVPVTGLNLSASEATVEYGETLKIDASIVPSDATYNNIKWETSDVNVATVKDGLVTATGVGTCTIKAVTEDGNFEKTCVITVTKALKSVDFNDSEARVGLNAEKTLKYTITPADATNVTINFRSSDESIVTVTSDGTIKGISAGEAVVYISTPDGMFVDTINVTVTKIDTEDLIIPTEREFLGNNSYEFAAKVDPEDSDDAIIAKSTNEDVAYWENGILYTGQDGMAVITFTSGNIERYAEIKVTNHMDVTRVKKATTGNVITWKGIANGVASYVLYKSEDGSEPYVIADTDAIKFTDRKVESGVVYTYFIKVKNASGEEYPEGKSVSFQFLSVPEITIIDNGKAGNRLEWNDVNGATAYDVYRKTAEGDLILVGTTTGGGYIDTESDVIATQYKVVAKSELAVAESELNILDRIFVSESITSIGPGAFVDGATKLVVLNKDAEFVDESASESTVTTIYGYKDSTAEEYAALTEKIFVMLDESDCYILEEDSIATLYNIYDEVVNFTGDYVYGDNSYFLINGKSSDETGLINIDGEMYYINNGQRSNETTLVKYNNAWWYIKDGKVSYDETLVKYNNAWWYVRDGKMSKDETLVKYNNAWWYVKDGKMCKDETLVKYNNAWWYVKDGKLCKNETLVKYNNAWWYVKDGKMCKTESFVSYNSSLWYAKDGKMQSAFSGTVTINGVTKTVSKGKVVG